MRSVLIEESGLIAKSFAANELWRNDQIVGGVFVPSSKQEKVLEAAAQSVWNAASGDEVQIFETEPQRSEIVNFFIENPEFLQEAVTTGREVSLTSLPGALSVWSESTTDRISLEHLDYLRGVSFFISCRFGQALEILDPLARVTTNVNVVVAAGESALNIGQYSVALRHFERALSLNSDAISHASIRRALWLSNVGACHEEMLESEEALVFYHRALDLVSNSSDSVIELLVRALILNNIGYSLMTVGDAKESDTNLVEAQRCFEAALEVRERFQDTASNLAIVFFNLAEVRRKQGDSAEASFYLDRARGALQRLELPHILMASIENAEGQALFERKCYVEALSSFRSARAILSQHFGDYGIKSLLTSYSIAQTLEAMGDPEAEVHLLHAKRMALKSIDDRHHPIIRMIESDLASPPSKTTAGFIRKLFWRR